MEGVANKLRKGIDLELEDLEAWAQYNYLIFNQADQDQLQAFVQRANRLRAYMVASFPAVAFGAFAINRY